MGGLSCTILAAAALVALPLLAAPPARSDEQHGAAPSNEVNSAAYPKAPGGMPAASDKGKPVLPASDPAATPGAPAKASIEGAPTKTGTPSSAYPGAPGGEPAAADQGKPVKP